MLEIQDALMLMLDDDAVLAAIKKQKSSFSITAIEIVHTIATMHTYSG